MKENSYSTDKKFEIIMFYKSYKTATVLSPPAGNPEEKSKHTFFTDQLCGPSCLYKAAINCNTNLQI